MFTHSLKVELKILSVYWLAAVRFGYVFSEFCGLHCCSFACLPIMHSVWPAFSGYFSIMIGLVFQVVPVTSYLEKKKYSSSHFEVWCCFPCIIFKIPSKRISWEVLVILCPISWGPYTLYIVKYKIQKNKLIFKNPQSCSPNIFYSAYFDVFPFTVFDLTVILVFCMYILFLNFITWLFLI